MIEQPRAYQQLPKNDLAHTKIHESLNSPQYQTLILSLVVTVHIYYNGKTEEKEADIPPQYSNLLGRGLVNFLVFCLLGTWSFDSFA